MTYRYRIEISTANLRILTRTRQKCIRTIAKVDDTTWRALRPTVGYVQH